MQTISFGYSPWLLLLAAVLAGVLSAWLYYRTTPDVGAKRWILGALRTAALITIAFLLIRPLLRSAQEVSKEPILAILVDSSESIGATANSDSTSEAVFDDVRTLLSRIPVNAIPGDVRIYSFGSEAVAVDVGDAWADSIVFDSERTNVSAALNLVTRDLQSENLGAVLLVSDGRHNTGRNPLFIAERFDAPIYTAVLGDTTIRRDLLIQSVVSNELGYVETELPVRVTVRADGYGRETVNVSISTDGAVVDSETLTLTESENERTVDLSFVPTAAGFKRITVSATRLAGEATYRNNRDVAQIQVLESKKKLLVIADAPSPDLSSTLQVLNEDKNIEVTTLVQRQGANFYSAATVDSLAGFDGIVLIGYPSLNSASTFVDRVVRAGEAGTPILFVEGRRTDLGILASKFGAIIPVQPTAIRTDFLDAAIAPTVEGNRHAIFDGLDINQSDWNRLPPLSFNNSRWKLSPGGRALANAQVRGVNLETPILAVGQRTGHRSVAILGTGFWRWRNVPEDLDDLRDIYPTLFSQALQWLTAVQDDRPVRVEPTEATFAGSDRIRFSGQVYDESLQPLSDAAVELSVMSDSGERYPFSMESSGNGRYFLDAASLPAGSYSYEASASRNGQLVGKDTGVFAVGKLAIEFKETRSDPSFMRQLAQRSGGDSFSAGQLSNLATILAQNDTFNPKIEVLENESELWRRYPFLALIIIFLTAEWFLRKRSGLV